MGTTQPVRNRAAIARGKRFCQEASGERFAEACGGGAATSSDRSRVCPWRSEPEAAQRNSFSKGKAPGWSYHPGAGGAGVTNPFDLEQRSRRKQRYFHRRVGSSALRSVAVTSKMNSPKKPSRRRTAVRAAVGVPRRRGHPPSATGRSKDLRRRRTTVRRRGTASGSWWRWRDRAECARSASCCRNPAASASR